MFKVWQKLDPHKMIFQWSKCDKSFSIAGHLKEHENPHGRKAFQMLKVWQELLEIGPLKELWEDPHRREAFHVFKVWQKLLEIRPLSKPTAAREAIYKRMQEEHGQFYVVRSRVGLSGQPHLLTQKCNIKTYFLCSFSLIGWGSYTITLWLIAHIKTVLASFINVHSAPRSGKSG